MNGSAGSSQPTGAKLVDDFLRRELRVGDPKSATEVADALRRMYAADASRIEDEGRGFSLAFQADAGPPVQPRAVPSASEIETARALDSVDRDLAHLETEAGNRERRHELEGWRDTILAEWAVGLDAARQAQDPAGRERAFYAIGKLSDFARVSRLAGVAYQELFDPYRRLAASLDACGNVLRVHIGEALYRSGLADGGLIVPMPLADARARRDGIVMAMRRLTGVEVEDGDWPDGLVSLGALRAAIDNEQRGDLRVCLREESLAAILDGLLADASRLSPESLRDLAASGLVDVTRLSELQALIATNAIPPSPPLASLTENLRLFLAFFGAGAAGAGQSRAGARIIDLAVPAPLSWFGAYAGDAVARGQLRSLAAWRHALAATADTVLPPPQLAPAPAQQIEIDTALYSVDRAIDHLSQGQASPPYNLPGAEAEERAGAYLAAVAALFPVAAMPALAAMLPAVAGMPPGVAAVLPAVQDRGLEFEGIFTAAAPIPVARPATRGQVAQDFGRRTLGWNAMVRAVSPR